MSGRYEELEERGDLESIAPCFPLPIVVDVNARVGTALLGEFSFSMSDDGADCPSFSAMMGPLEIFSPSWAL